MAELDKDFTIYAAKWKGRLKLSDRHIAEGFMAGQGGPAHMAPEDLPRVHGFTDVHILLEGANLSVAFDPADLDAMVADWQRELDMHDMDPRVFTRRFLYEGMALNRHRDEDDASAMLLAALWFVISKPESEGLSEALKHGDCGLFVEIIVEQEPPKQVIRTRAWVEDYSLSG